MTVGFVHRLSLTATLALPVLGLLSGSAILFVACLAYLTALIFGFGGLHRVEREFGRTLVVHVLTLLGLAYAIFIFRQAPIDAGLIVVMLGGFNRFLLRGGQRDDLILVGAAGVLLAAATVVTPGIAFAFILLFFVPSALWTMLSASILALAESAPDARQRRQLHQRYAARPAPRLGGTLTSWGLVLMLVGYAAVALMPRYRFGHLLSPGGFMTFSGAGSHMRLTAGGVTGGSDGSVALRITGMNTLAAIQGLYARVYVLDSFDGAGFYDSEGARKPFDFGRISPMKHPPKCLHVNMRRQAPRGQPHPVAVLGRSQPEQVVIHRLDRLDSGTWVTWIANAALDVRYLSCPGRFVEAPLPEDELVRARYLARYTALPDSLDPRIWALSKRLIQGVEDPKFKVQRVLEHFADGYRYQLEPLEGASDDPLVRFLFEAKAGHCELFAGALAVLLRASGVPARVAAGYYGGWFNQRNRALEMGSEDAHAWVEVLLDGQWQWIDATPESQRARRTHKSFAWIRDVWDALEGLWFQYVIDFDEERRKQFVNQIKAQLPSALQWGDIDHLKKIKQGPSLLGRRALWIFPLIGGLVLIAALVQRRRSEVQRTGLQLRALLDGADRSTPLGILIQEQPASVQPIAASAVRAYEAYRFGPHDRRPDWILVRDRVRSLSKVKIKEQARVRE